MFWYDMQANESECVLTSSVSVLRNIEHYPFSPRLDRSLSEEICSRVSEALPKENYTFFDISKLQSHESAALCQKGYLSENSRYLFLDEKRGIAVSLIGREHIEIRSFCSGLDTVSALEKASCTDDLLDGSISYAFDKELGYLTSHPGELGCALKLHALLFLPALEESEGEKEIKGLFSDAGINASSDYGYFYSVDLPCTLGHSEQESALKFSHSIISICSAEKERRTELYIPDISVISDRIMRSFGCAKYARLISERDMTRVLADLRLGICLDTDGYILDRKRLDRVIFEELYQRIQDASSRCKKSDSERADLLSKMLSAV